jgi:predicted ribosomally synthesized peptide with nif11-like leader
MAIGSARDFLTKVRKDAEFCQRLRDCKSRAEQSEFVRQAGFQFSREEIRAASGELEDADLDMISGGAQCCGLNPECASND